MTTPTGSWSGTRRSFPKATARRILKRDGHQCQLAYHGCTIDATAADHIIGHAEATHLGWTQAEIDHPTNGQAVCDPCHKIKTTAEQQQGRRRAKAARAARRQRKHPGLI